MGKLLDKLYEMYLIQNYHYLIQFKSGQYITRNDRAKGIKKHHLNSHIAGTKTIGTFAGKYLTKFISFDVDYRDNDKARWVTYKLAYALDSIGVQYAISFSGNKGYHVDIFLDKAISVESAQQFFDFIVKLADVDSTEGGQVEYRPSSVQGVKLPLGVHQKTGNYCGFCKIENGLNVMDVEESIEYFLALEKTDHTVILEAIAKHSPSYESKEAEDMENAISRYKPLEIYDQSESNTLKRAAERYSNGLTSEGQRHNSFLLLARLFNHNGVDQEDAYLALVEWLSWQDKRYYTSDWDFCVKDAREVIDYVYEKNLTLTMEPRDLTVSFSEIDAIIRSCPQKNQKALMYAMLIHSKMWAGDDGVFYFTYKQMHETAGVDPSTVYRQIDKLEELGVIHVVRRNQKIKGSFKKKPNFYRVTLDINESVEERLFLVGENSEGGGIDECLRFFYDEKELRKILPRRQYAALLS